MIDVRPFSSMGHANHGWLDARHHFRFADYHNPSRMGYMVPAPGRVAMRDPDRITITALEDSELVLVDAAI